MGIFSDMELGQIILVGAVIILAFIFGGKNIFRDDGGKGGSKGGSNTNSTGGTEQ